MEQHSFVDLNTAFFEDGVVVEVAPKTVVADPLHIVCLTSPARQATMVCPRILVMAGELSLDDAFTRMDQDIADAVAQAGQ